MASSSVSTQRVSWNAPAVMMRYSIGSTSTVAFFAGVEVGSAPAAGVEITHDAPPFSHGAGDTMMGDTPASRIRVRASSGVSPVTWHRSSTEKSSSR